MNEPVTEAELARAAARAAIKVKDEALTKAQWVLNNTSSNWPEQHHEARTLVTAALSHA